MVPPEMTPAISTSLDDSSQKKLDKLRDAKSEDFASNYDPMQVSAHKDAVSHSSAMQTVATTPS